MSPGRSWKSRRIFSKAALAARFDLIRLAGRHPMTPNKAEFFE
jgi:hypothetical protein